MKKIPTLFTRVYENHKIKRKDFGFKWPVKKGETNGVVE